MPYRRVRNSCSAREGHVALAFSSTKWMVHQLQPQELTGRVGCLGPNTADGKKTVEHTMLSKRTSKCPQKPTSCTQAGSTQCSLFPSKPPHDSVSLCNLCVFTHSCIFSIKIPHSLPLAHFHVRWSGDASLLTYFLLSTIDFFLNCYDNKLSSLWEIHPLHCYLHIFFHVCLTRRCVYYILTRYYILLPVWLCCFPLLKIYEYSSNISSPYPAR